MSTLKDPFEVLVVEEGLDEFEALSRRSVSPASPAAAPPDAATARFHGFDQDDCPLLVGVAALPHEIVPARTTVPLWRSHIGSTVVLLFENGDVRRPIVVGVLQEQRGPRCRCGTRSAATRERAGRRRSPGAVGGTRDRPALRRRQRHADPCRQGDHRGPLRHQPLVAGTTRSRARRWRSTRQPSGEPSCGSSTTTPPLPPSGDGCATGPGRRSGSSRSSARSTSIGTDRPQSPGSNRRCSACRNLTASRARAV